MLLVVYNIPYLNPSFSASRKWGSFFHHRAQTRLYVRDRCQAVYLFRIAPCMLNLFRLAEFRFRLSHLNRGGLARVNSTELAPAKKTTLERPWRWVPSVRGEEWLSKNSFVYASNATDKEDKSYQFCQLLRLKKHRPPRPIRSISVKV